MSFEQGQVLASRYRLEERIATGGMGEVWRALDQTLDRCVAVKVLRPDTSDDHGFAERFRAEARHMGALTHQNIGTVHDFGEDDGTAYLVMEYLDGRPLSTVIRDEAPMDPRRVSDILVQVASALQAAHDAEVIHRDVKPANIVVSADDEAKLTDFGISRALSEAPMTQTGEVLGTPHYLSPEQAQGMPAGPLSDVYALAVVGYEMITGERPFAGDSMVTTALAHVATPAPPLPPGVPEPLRTTVMASLAKDPALRPQSAQQFAEALRTRPDELPDTLRLGAASAVAPVVVGVPLTLPPDVPLPTSIISTPEATILTPPGMGPLALSAQGVVTPLVAPATAQAAAAASGAPAASGAGTGRPDGLPADGSGRTVRRLLVAAGIVVVVIVVAVAIASTGSHAGQQGPATHSPSAPPASVTSAPATTATSAATTTAGAAQQGTPAHAHGKGKGGRNK
jgi:serine/threonine-protein kinase